MPVLTESSSKRGWVHQEIGYALARNVPVLPVVKDTIPEQMLQTLNAIVLDPKLDVVRKLPSALFS